mmetsp:Transcript_50121/g.58515  ORF Transcript_50121/g.58515 Transcript_50121/m.58515 type:complete len:108 (-) Transcript_50121:42-365(-)
MPQQSSKQGGHHIPSSQRAGSRTPDLKNLVFNRTVFENDVVERYLCCCSWLLSESTNLRGVVLLKRKKRIVPSAGLKHISQELNCSSLTPALERDDSSNSLPLPSFL